jgi:hypothetical protein
MSTPYYGFQTFITSAPSATSPYGRFIVGDSADDGDLDDAQHLMALAMNATDQIQWLGWRVGYLNVVEGSAGNPALGAQITNYNAWVLNGGWTFQAASTVEFKGPTYMGAGATLHIGSSVFGVGQLIADGSGSGAGSNIFATGGADIIADGSGSELRAQNGAGLRVDSASEARFDNVIGTTLDPGHDNALFGSNIIKCVAVFVTDGEGGLNIVGGYNFGAISLTGTNARITFARAMVNAHYCVKGTISTSSGPFKVYVPGVIGATTAHLDIAACATLDNAVAGSYVNLITTTDIVTFRIEVTCPK